MLHSLLLRQSPAGFGENSERRGVLKKGSAGLEQRIQISKEKGTQPDGCVPFSLLMLCKDCVNRCDLEQH